jgi:Mor family transcriptional regulator
MDGKSVAKLADKYSLSEKTIYKILSKFQVVNTGEINKSFA